MGVATDKLGAFGDHRHVRQGQRLGETRQRLRLLADRFDQEPAEIGSGNGEREGRHPAAGSKVDGERRLHVTELRKCGQRVEQVPARHLVRVSQTRQVEPLVGRQQQLDVGLHPVQRAVAQLRGDLGERGEIGLQDVARGASGAGQRLARQRSGHEDAPAGGVSVFPVTIGGSAGSRIGPDHARLPYSATGGSRSHIVPLRRCGEQPAYPRRSARFPVSWISHRSILASDGAQDPWGRYDRSLVAADLTQATGPRFAHASEAELARILDFYKVAWRYEPDVYPISWNASGAVVECFAPDFYLPEIDLYLELTTLKQSLVRKKNRKLRWMRLLYPEIRVKLLYARDFRALMLKYGRLDFLHEVLGANGQPPSPRSVTSPRPSEPAA